MTEAQEDASVTTLTPSRAIARTLRQQITRGDFTTGDVLPSERELVATYAVARNTVRDAIRLLTVEGLVTPRHGRGVFVNAPGSQEMRLPADLTAAIEQLAHQQGRSPAQVLAHAVQSYLDAADQDYTP